MNRMEFINSEVTNFCNFLCNVKPHDRHQFQQQVITIRCLEPDVITVLMAKINKAITIGFILFFDLYPLFQFSYQCV
jgi:hypothetical protein